MTALSGHTRGYPQRTGPRHRGGRGGSRDTTRCHNESETSDSLAKPELASKFHDNALRSLPEKRAAEVAARTLALPDAQSVEDLTALLTSAGER